MKTIPLNIIKPYIFLILTYVSPGISVNGVTPQSGCTTARTSMPQGLGKRWEAQAPTVAMAEEPMVEAMRWIPGL